MGCEGQRARDTTVRQPARLRRTAKHMEGYGERLQDSVFRCWLTPRRMQKLRWELTELVAVEDDVLMIPLCAQCVSGIQVTHAATKRSDWATEPDRHRIV